MVLNECLSNPQLVVLVDRSLAALKAFDLRQPNLFKRHSPENIFYSNKSQSPDLDTLGLNAVYLEAFPDWASRVCRRYIYSGMSLSDNSYYGMHFGIDSSEMHLLLSPSLIIGPTTNWFDKSDNNLAVSFFDLLTPGIAQYYADYRELPIRHIQPITSIFLQDKDREHRREYYLGLDYTWYEGNESSLKVEKTYYPSNV